MESIQAWSDRTGVSVLAISGKSNYAGVSDISMWKKLTKFFGGNQWGGKTHLPVLVTNAEWVRFIQD